MKELGIITHYDVHNHGAILQLQALKNILKKLGVQAEALTFDKDLRYISHLYSKYNISIKSIPYYTKYLFAKGVKKTFYNIDKKLTLDKYKVENNLVGEKFGSVDKDMIIVGSDEVFSTESGLAKEFFAVDSPYERTISYAGSFGTTTYDDIIEKNENEYLSAGFANFEALSVRDNNSKEILDKMGFESTLVCDPVILYGYHDEIADDTIKIKKLKKYLLVYAYDNNMNEKTDVAKIKSFAKSKGLLTVSVGFFHKWCDKSINADPVQLLKYFKNAEVVVTDTFHGTVMSIVTNTPMLVKLRTNANKLEWLLTEYNLRDRIITSFDELELLSNQKVDFEIVNKIVTENRGKSLEWLRGIIVDGKH